MFYLFDSGIAASMVSTSNFSIIHHRFSCLFPTSSSRVRGVSCGQNSVDVVEVVVVEGCTNFRKTLEIDDGRESRSFLVDTVANSTLRNVR